MAEAPKQAYPEAEDEASFLQLARERFQEASDYDRENRDAAFDDLEFLAGKQWDETVERNRKDKGKPCLTINRLPQFVAQVVGDIRLNRPGIKVRPAEDGDEKIAEVRQGLIRAIEQQSKAHAVYSNAGTAQVGCGIGAFRIGLDYAADDVFDRDIRIKPIKNPFSVVWDPLIQDSTGRDARYCFVVDEMDRREYEAAYPEKSDTGELSVPLEAEGWCSKDVVRVTEYWLIKETPTTIHLLPDGSISDVVPKGVKPLRSRETVKRTACMYLITGHAVLEGPYELPIDRVPIFRVPGWEVNIGAKSVRWGLVRFAKDPQRLMNFWRSVSAELLATAPKQQWLVHGDEDYADEFRNAHLSGDTVLRWQGPTPPQRVDPPAIPAAVLQEAAMNAQDMKDVTGLHDASLGAQSNETSGRAIMARDRQGDVATYIYPDNLREAIGECGRVANMLLPVVYDTTRTVRTLGDDETPRQVRLNDPTDPESIDLGSGKYDVVVEAGPSYSTKRVEAAESMMQFVQAVPNAGQVAGDLVAKAQDWPMADEIAERLKRAMPPQITMDPENPDPQAMQAKAQADAMQQQATAIQSMEAEARAKKAVADAAKAEAEAGKAQAELAMMTGQIDREMTRRAQLMAAATLFGQGAMPTPEFPAAG